MFHVEHYSDIQGSYHDNTTKRAQRSLCILYIYLTPRAYISIKYFHTNVNN